VISPENQRGDFSSGDFSSFVVRNDNKMLWGFLVTSYGRFPRNDRLVFLGSLLLRNDKIDERPRPARLKKTWQVEKELVCFLEDFL
jgi:hypothetical protein